MAHSTAELLRAELQGRCAWARERGAAYDLAVWQLLAGRPEESLETLRAEPAAARQRPSQPAHRRPEWALVAGEWKRAGEEARAALRESTERLVPGLREYVRALYALVAGEPDLAAGHAGKLRAYVERHGRLRSGHPAGTVEIVDGLIRRSSERLSAGVDALLSWHLRRSRARSEIFNSASAVVSLDALAVLLLAHRLGLAPEIAPAYRRAAVPLLAIHLAEWEGEPLPRALKLTLETDLVAGEWLRLNGVRLSEPPPPVKRRTPTRRARRLKAEVGEDAVRESLAGRLRARRGSAWQLASWALMLGDLERARAHLVEEAAAARRRWQESAVAGGGWRLPAGRGTTPPNANHLREHFALALVLGDEAALAETGDLLRAHDPPAPPGGRFAHVAGYLDLVRVLLEGGARRRARVDGEEIGGPLPSVRVACAGLAGRDRPLFERGLGGMLEEHTRALERRSSPAPPVCAPAVHVAAAADRLGLRFDLGAAVREYGVPIAVQEEGGRVGRIPCDLLGEALWRSVGPPLVPARRADR